MSLSSTRQHIAEQQDNQQWPSPRAQAIFAFAAVPVEDDNKRYRTLIERERTHQHLTYDQLAARTGIQKHRLWRLLTSNSHFPAAERDAILVALDIDLSRARIAVSFFQDIDLYNDVCGLNIAYACAAFARQFAERRDELHITINPAILDEAISRTFKMLLRHQDHVMQSNTRLHD